MHLCESQGYPRRSAVHFKGRAVRGIIERSDRTLAHERHVRGPCNGNEYRDSSFPVKTELQSDEKIAS